MAVPIEALFSIKVVFNTVSEPSSINDIAPPRPKPVVDSSVNAQHKFSLSLNNESLIIIYGACKYLQAPIAPPPLLVVQLLPMNLVLYICR